VPDEITPPSSRYGIHRIEAALQAFRRVEQRPDLDARNYRDFGLTLNQWNENRMFLEMILGRYDTAIQRFSESQAAVSATRPRTGAVPQTDPATTQRAVHRVIADMHLLQLEIRSFYLFAKILLDRVADSIAFFSGRRLSARGARHEFLVRGFHTVASERQFEVSDEFKGHVSGLRESVIDYRDRLVDHLRDARAMSGVAFGPDGPPTLEPLLLFPGGGPLQGPRTPSGNLHVLVREIDAYLLGTVDFFEKNHEKSVLCVRRT
jgi:hypothetical protein